jgi:cytochrome c oxidase cbb3-type subunit 1
MIKIRSTIFKLLSTAFVLLVATEAMAQNESFNLNLNKYPVGLILLAILYFGFLIAAVIFLSNNSNKLIKDYYKSKEIKPEEEIKNHLQNLSAAEIDMLLKNKSNRQSITKKSALMVLMILSSSLLFAQNANSTSTLQSLLHQPGIIISLTLIMIPLFVLIIILVLRANASLIKLRELEKLKRAKKLAEYIKDIDITGQEEDLLKRKAALEYELQKNELSGNVAPDDDKGLLNNISHDHSLHLFATKKNPIKRPKIDPELSKLILWYLGTAIIWLVIGTSVGEYLGIKFVAPDADHISWLSFGRLRPVHTNLVFWAWSTIAIMGLGYYVIPITSNAPIYSIKKGWLALKLVNVAMFVGAISVMAGFNNGGGEYKEFVWPIMAVWAAGLAITLYNFIKTIANRKTKEIYISNWFIVASFIFILIVATVAYLPFGQTGIGETILQGYYMHQAVGLWFMFSNLGFLYYFLPQQLNKPIYSYSLGVLAFWSNIFFYTMIGTHHFVFSALPWWLQTTAIVSSAGMMIPVAAGAINYLMTFKGDFKKVGTSYTLPFYLVGIVFYFTGSYQGTAEAFRYTNQLWHFTDFTIAHSHITMYGIISFILFASTYAIVPRLTGKEPPKLTVGAHFWLSFIGLLFYTIPLMIGGTLKGLMWMEQKPFIDSVIMMAPYWLWRAIGGSMMWAAHIIFAYNFYKMTFGVKPIDVKQKAFEIAQANATLVSE